MAKLDFNKEVKTRDGHDVRIYHAYPYALHGAWYNDNTNVWISTTWSVPNGYSIWSVPDGYIISRSSLDLINV